MKNKNIKNLLISIFLVIGVFTLTFFLLKEDDNKEKVEDFNLNLESSIVSTDPKISATNFIHFNGTMGDLSLINQEYFNKVQEETNSDRRKKAYDIVKSAIIPGSPMLSEDIEETIKLDTLDFPVFFEVKNIKVGEPSEEYTVPIFHNSQGEVKYKAVDILVDFSTFQHSFYWPTDAEGENVITHMRTGETFKDIKVTLVKSADLWFIYDIEDAEYNLNRRFATWQGKGKVTISQDALLIDEYKINKK